ncbi:hypothetical protein TIFTF001_011131 [Ficus carica]|uniref:Uncharacterized protein n=1 Tax=Ficus carica TaxID=3494 RepID=A0AA88ADH0_FICCA|nr:hypothetical protein TIFTF001_011131 [Ficus carica]
MGSDSGSDLWLVSGFLALEMKGVLQQLSFTNPVSYIDVVVSPPSVLVVYPSNLNLDGVLVLLELLIYGVSNDLCARFQCADVYTRYRA